MAKNNKITLYDLQLESGCTISPYVWRTKYALAHKGFDVELVPGGFTGILERTGGRSEAQASDERVARSQREEDHRFEAGRFRKQHSMLRSAETLINLARLSIKREPRGARWVRPKDQNGD